MSRQSLPAILLRRQAYGDTSQILRFLTSEYGVLAVLARGVRTQGSRGRGGGLEILAQGSLELEYREGRSLHVFRGFEADPERSVRGFAREILALAGASYVAEIVLAHAVEGEPQEELFPYIGEVFSSMEAAAPGTLPWMVVSAGWGVMRQFGFPPALMECVICDADFGELSPEARVRFDLQAGGVRCVRCASGGAGPKLGPRALDALRRLAFGQNPDDSATRLEGALGQFRLLDRFIRFHLGIEWTFRSTSIVEERIGAMMQQDS